MHYCCPSFYPSVSRPNKRIITLANEPLSTRYVTLPWNHNQLHTKDVYQKRDLDSYKIFNRKRNAHACIMSIVFIVLYPLGASSIHLPIGGIPYLKNTYLKNKVMAMHAPIQGIAFVMMIGGLALGISIGHDLGFLQHPVHAHVVIGLFVVCSIIVFQPVMGILQHWHFKKTGGRSIFAYLHRWTGRIAIVLGMINNGLGFQLAESNVAVPTSSYVRNFVLLGIFVSTWLGLVVKDQFRLHLRRTVRNEKRHGSSKEMALDPTKVTRSSRRVSTLDEEGNIQRN